ncbi:homocysteine S-methyltransferase family protein [Cobetia marina]|uniref:Homocysteine S-methyltransferase family protein n=1 Tax=Cobetia marina TaxID=28258 RepID=A0ABU9GIH8_COBMA
MEQVAVTGAPAGEGARAGDVVLLDGGMGQELVRRSGREPTPLWSSQVMLDQPELVRDLHLDFIRAGSRVITLNTYTATPQRLTLAGVGETIGAVHAAAGKAARDAIALSGETDIRVAGCLPPLVATYRPDVAPDQEESLASYRTLVALQAPLVDVLLCEALSSHDEAQAAATAALESGLPVWVSLTVKDDLNATLRSGEPLADTVAMLEALGVDAILINCSAPEAIQGSLDTLLGSSLPAGAYANGFTSIAALKPGGTVKDLKVREDLGPEQYAAHALGWVQRGLRIVGGCCEVGPAHIACLSEQLKAAGHRCVSRLGE